ncbi:MAG: hypothetical protein ABSE82_05800 [Nitrososphaerales archaeon]
MSAVYLEHHGLNESNVVKVLTECGCDCFVMRMRGGSGENYQFDFLCRKAGERFVITGVESNDRRSEGFVVNLRVKTLNSNTTTVVVL